MIDKIFEQDYHALTLKDILQARDFYHVYLMNMKNVVGTAVGRYLIRHDDPWPTPDNPSLKYKESKKQPGKKPKKPRTLDKSEIRPYSWPCILVFIKNWEKEKSLLINGNNNVIPKHLNLPDGRTVPVCVVEAKRDTYEQITIDPSKVLFPSNYICGGFPIITHQQGEERLASVGCLVSDGGTTFALTNKHALGEPGEKVFTILNGIETEIGVTYYNQLGRVPFSGLYPEFPGRDMLINADVGLIRINDKDDWKTAVNNLGQIGKVVDISSERFPLNIVGQEVIGCGSVSGRMRGRIMALFYRYKALGGFEYLSDFLVGPIQRENGSTEKDRLDPKHGDSGTLWLMEDETEEEGKEKTELRPVAIQWGRHIFAGEGQAQPYSLATCLSTVLKKLDVDIVQDWNIDQDFIWGKVGHNTIGATVAEQVSVTFPNLKRLMELNVDHFYSAGAQGTDDMLDEDGNAFCPLAIVPDDIWKMRGTMAKGITRSPKENPLHYADIDMKDMNGEMLIKKEPNAKAWVKFYDEKTYDEKDGVKDRIDKNHRGALPFRIGQVFEEMIGFVLSGKRDEFICSSGVLAHYIADAAMPLHCSIYANGDGTPESADFHSFVDSKLIAKYQGDINKDLGKKIKSLSAALPVLQTKDDAVKLALSLMKDSLKIVKISDLLSDYKTSKILKGSERSAAVWNEWKGPIIKTMANGCKYLAHFIEQAWQCGNGEANIPAADIKKALRKDLSALYKNKSFLESKPLEEH